MSLIRLFLPLFCLCLLPSTEAVGEISCYANDGYYQRACYNGATCHRYSTICDCRSGFEGVSCELNTNDCLEHSCESGVCVDLIGGYKCECDEGFKGDYCNEHLDQCEEGTHSCQNNAECIDEPLGTYKCACATHEKYKYALFDGARCERRVNPCTDWPFDPCGMLGKCTSTTDDDGFRCDCYKGFTGDDCTTEIDECAQSTHKCSAHGLCQNTYGSYRCNCESGWTGQLCENEVNACEHNRCAEGSTCVDTAGDYRCECARGKIGRFCTLDDPCAANPCGIDGKCALGVHEAEGTFRCECSPGITGARCERDVDECVEAPCRNNGTCVNVHGSYRCECDGFYGRNCELEITESADRCERFSCASKAQNGRCDVECNVFSCAFDGGDCSSSDERPFAECPNAGFCMRAFRDGHCDPECASEECLFDGFDCDRVLSHRCSPQNEKFCRTNFANGKCNRNCNSIGCGWDGGDCVIASQQEDRFKLKDHVAIVLLTEPDVLAAGLTSILMLLNRELKALITVARDYRNRPLIYDWDNVNLSQNLIDLNTAQLKKNPVATLQGILVRFSIDTNVCHEWNRDDCFTDVHTVASFLSTPPIRESFSSIGFDLESVFATEAPEIALHHVMITATSVAISLAFLSLFVFLLIFMVRCRRRRSDVPNNISLHFDVNREEMVTITGNGNLSPGSG